MARGSCGRICYGAFGVVVGILLLSFSFMGEALAQQNSDPKDPSATDSTCLETISTGQCVLLWQVDTTSATGSSSQSSNNTTPNIIVKLDYQWHSPKSRPKKQVLLHQLEAESVTSPFLIKRSSELHDNDKLKESLKPHISDHLVGHFDFKTGYTQAVAATTVQPTSGGTGTSTSCPGGSSTSGSTCSAAVPQEAFIAEAAARFGWSTGVDDQQVFGEFGFGARGSFQYLISNNKIVQSGGLTYIDLSSANPHNAVGFYEATGHFRLAQIGHNTTSADAGPGIENVSDLLVVEGGFQNNRALQQLMSSDVQTDTRNRYVARLYVHPEIPNTKHTQLTMGIEYSGGLNGGPHVVQLFFGTTLNPAKLFKSSN